MSRWRHLDLGTWRLEIRAELRRLRCPTHGVRVEAVPFARHGSGFTTDFEALVAWLATKTDKTTITRLVRIDWETACPKRCSYERVPLVPNISISCNNEYSADSSTPAALVYPRSTSPKDRSLSGMDDSPSTGPMITVNVEGPPGTGRSPPNATARR